ncbi:MAG TPA: DUF3788 family protein [Bacteroidales bacterium]|nr:DUF3788 family protein [Bacteroidales bacterium]
MDKPKLNDPEINPTDEVLSGVLGNSYVAYVQLMNTITGEKYLLVPEWHYYNDGKSWLCKVTYKKKTVFWLSAWDGFFKTSFYFTEKNSPGIAGLEIEKSIKDDFFSNKAIGKLLPLSVSISTTDQINDLLKIVEYKKSLK